MDKSISLADRLRETIEENIATGELPPGAPLDEAELTQRFRVSRTPVREALMQLASAGMVDIRRRRGATVAQISPQRLIEMFEVMAELEAMCGRHAARRMSTAELLALEAAHTACEAARNAADADRYYHLNEHFHNLIYAGSHSGFLCDQAQALHRRLRPYRRLQLRVKGRLQASYSEHQAVVDAIRAGDGDRAAQALRGHVMVQGERFADLMAVLSQMPA
ncbi:MAG: GntR family transcriptional regulator [Betaproteobacteria bacterium]|nr:GntR family transcriptional regulator [Betaproteobacteria bacterium]MDE2123093.1 GntR family transcriptional regulator [Betaproteobacteria bacterium]MDE2185521.1 GntR family transcriptional regulator [Betaproteobacteria bacterium]MDE2324292.1 GntR family transcriptional regulator [Betaproteobacteria bacterium]